MGFLGFVEVEEVDVGVECCDVGQIVGCVGDIVDYGDCVDCVGYGCDVSDGVYFFDDVGVVWEGDYCCFFVQQVVQFCGVEVVCLWIELLFVYCEVVVFEMMLDVGICFVVLI